MDGQKDISFLILFFPSLFASIVPIWETPSQKLMPKSWNAHNLFILSVLCFLNAYPSTKP
jgi:hypothetical protein